MVSKHSRKDPLLNSFHHTDSLLFQFILSEVFKGFSILIKIEKMRGTAQKPEAFANSMRQLAGAGIGLQRYFPWNPEEGVFSRLKAYVDYLAEKWSSDPDAKVIHDLQKCVHHLWSASMDTLAVLEATGMEEFPAKFDKAQAFAQKLKKALTKALICFKDDENVVFFILRHHAAFSAIYGIDSTHKLLDKMYSGGVAEAKMFLQKTYAKRQFCHLAPVINTFFNHLESV